MRSIRTKANRARFLQELADTANVTAACQAIGVSRVAVYDWRKEDAEFAAKWEAALELGTDALEDEAVRRARDGVDEPVFYKGAECGSVRRYSDNLLMFMLKARRPEKFKERVANEHTGAGGGPLEVKVIRYGDLSEDELGALQPGGPRKP